MNVSTLQEMGFGEESDEEILEITTENRCILLTNDKDFLVIASRMQRDKRLFAPIFFWAQQGRSPGTVA